MPSNSSSKPSIESVEHIRKQSFRVIVWIGVSCILLAFVVMNFYFDVFKGDWSDNSADWGAFGSYFGGVFTPIVSIVSTLAVFYTITLQRLILRETQTFSQDTLAKQQQQIDDSNKSSLYLALENHRNRLLKSTEQQIFSLAQECLILQEKINQGNQAWNSSAANRMGLVRYSDETADQQLQSKQWKIERLNHLMLRLALDEFKDIPTMNSWYQEGLLKILPYSLDEDIPDINNANEWEEVK